jgi:NADH:ubiquinone oxidoreductase subunit 6 (subunit J)
MWNISALLSYYAAMILGACTLAIAVQNPIHALLMLIFAFIMGSLLLTMFALDYFALLFLIVYVGAIVVLFLFIVMMLELKMVNISERFRDLFNYRNLILPSLLVELLLLEQADVFHGLSSFHDLYMNKDALVFTETNLHVDYAKILVKTDLLSALGMALFRYEKVGILLASLLLFVSMVGSILLTMDSKVVTSIKSQDANLQALRNPVKATNSFRDFSN